MSNMRMTKSSINLLSCVSPKTVFLKFSHTFLMKSKIKIISKKFAGLGARAILVCPFLTKSQFLTK